MAKSDLEFSNREDLEAWLKDKPIEWSQVIAARAALRVFPFVWKYSPELTLNTFRANFISWAACNYPAHDMRAAASFAADAAASAATRSASSASFAAADASSAAAADASSAASSASSASFASFAATRSASSLMWQTIRMDAACLEETDQAHELIHQPLWPDEEGNKKSSGGVPEWVLARLTEFSNTKIGEITHSDLIFDWYYALLPVEEGQKPISFFGEEADLAIALKPDEFWKRGNDDEGVEAVLAGIAQIVEENGGGGKDNPPIRSDVNQNSDEPTAKDELGRRPFAESLVEKINEVREEAPDNGFAVHLHAPWGAGKTSILLMMQDYMKQSVKKEAKDNEWVVVNFNAWEHERRNPPWWPLIEAVNRDCSVYLAEEAGIRSEGCIWQKIYDFTKEVTQNFSGTFRLSRRFAKQSRIKCDGKWWQKAFIWLYAVRLPFVRHPIGRWKLQKDRWYWWKLKTDYMPFCLAFLMIGILAFLFFFDNGSNSLLSNSLKIFAGLTGVTLTFLAATQSLVFGSKENANYYFQLSNDPLGRISKLFDKLIDGMDRPVCIYIDDLDRCHADFVVDLLEGIQSSFRHEKVTYVVAADKGWIRSAFETRYDSFNDHVGDDAQPIGYLFLEKIFQMSTPIPGMAAYVKQAYFDGLLGDKDTADEVTETPEIKIEKFNNAVADIEKKVPDLSFEKIIQYARENPTEETVAAATKLMDRSPKAEKDAKHLLKDFSSIVSGNPREMKRLLNAFAMRRTISLLQASTVSMDVLFRWTILEQSYPALADELIKQPELVENYHGELKKADDVTKDLALFIEIAAVYDIVCFGDRPPLTADHIRDIVYGGKAKEEL